MPKINDVARWMIIQLDEQGVLYQDIASYLILEKFGKSFTYINRNGNLAIDLKVLDAFRELTNERVVWDRGEKRWRKRSPNDEPGRQQS